MNIPPVLLLIIGSTFALFYSLIITFGWARTRLNRKSFQIGMGLDYLPVYDLVSGKINHNMPRVKTISLQNNLFETKEGEKINIAEYQTFIAIGKSANYPNIEEGNLILIDEKGKIKYAFDIPNLMYYR